MRTTDVSTELDAPAELVWQTMKTPHAFVHVAAGMLRFPAAERLDRPWAVGDELEGWTFLFGLIPFSRHRLRVASIDDGSHTLVSDEGGGIVRRWRHELHVEDIEGGRSRYRDRIELDAGPFTLAVAGFAALFYRYRQRRWRRLARLLAASTPR